jgi:4-oxalocrotonate tautomerase family enzyme
MPFVNIRINKPHTQAQKEEIARRVSAALSDVLAVPQEYVWTVFDNVPTDHWFVGPDSVTKLNAQG